MSKEVKKFSRNWNSSTKPKKQRKYRYNAPMHTKRKLLSAHLSQELKKKHQKRSAGLRTGDKVRIMRGEYKKKEGKVERLLLSRLKVYIEGVDRSKKDGTKVKIPIDPTNLMIIELNTKDKKREKVLARK